MCDQAPTALLGLKEGRRLRSLARKEGAPSKSILVYVYMQGFSGALGCRFGEDQLTIRTVFHSKFNRIVIFP